MSISADKVGVHNDRMTRADNTASLDARDPSSRATVTRIGAPRRTATTRTEVLRARAARRELRPRSERFAHLKRMYD
jgi:hypothetical protein